MLAIKKLLPHFFLQGATLVVLLLLAGCTPPGPRALLQGDRLLQEGHYQQALDKLKTATALLPRDPRVWNCLGLAYQSTGDGPHAIEAFRYALSLDHSNLVFVAHYNLGCAYLEQGNAVAAANELRSFCLLSNSLPALSKLATAELRSRQFDAAEKSFASLLKQRPSDAAAQNGLGLAFAQRNRPREAAQWFQSALKNDPKYAPALLNLAVIYHHQPAQKAYAAQKYREYLALEPHAVDADSVKAVLARLEQELAPRPAPTNAAPVLPPKTNAPVALTNAPPVPPRSSVTQHVAAVTTTNIPKPVAPAVVVTNVPKPPPAIAPVTNVVRPVTNLPRVVAPLPVVKAPPIVASNPPPIPLPPPPPPVPVVVVALSNETPLKPALDIPIKPAPPPVVAKVVPPVVITAAPPVAPASNLWVVRAAPPAKPDKTSFLDSLNPFRKKPKPAVPATNSIVIPTISPIAPVASNPVVAVAAAAPAPPRPVVPRYAYLTPAKPARGDRKAAEVFFHQAFKAQQDGKSDEAAQAYRAALEKDAAYFEAQYNAGLLAFQAADWPASLRCFETVLAITPEAVNARLNLGLALERANYPQDAADELEKVVSAKAEDTRAHLTLGSLYAQKLGQPARAREHYQKVLDLDPQHSQATAIRYWLAAHP